jgi:hypothetical protein
MARGEESINVLKNRNHEGHEDHEGKTGGKSLARIPLLFVIFVVKQKHTVKCPP